MAQDDVEEVNSEFWQEQIRLSAESRDSGAPHQRAKHAAQQSRGISLVATGLHENEDSNDGRGHPVGRQNIPHQTWNELDCGGQGLRALAPAIFRYQFLTRLVLTHNALDQLPGAIGQLKHLEHLDLSHNRLVDLPEEIGMLSNLKTLWLFTNQLTSLPDQLGYLYRLTTLGIEGNPLNEELKHRMFESGTKGLVKHLLENMSGESFFLLYSFPL